MSETENHGFPRGICVAARFLQEVVCELVLRDLESLLERYLRKMRKSFARMHWDLDVSGNQNSQLLPALSGGAALPLRIVRLLIDLSRLSYAGHVTR